MWLYLVDHLHGTMGNIQDLFERAAEIMCGTGGRDPQLALLRLLLDRFGSKTLGPLRPVTMLNMLESGFHKVIQLVLEVYPAGKLVLDAEFFCAYN
jgi:hypothetical protein